MEKQKEMPKRKLLRLAQYDYSTGGGYFITFCTYDRRNMLSSVVGAIHESPEPQLTGFGRVVEEVLHNIPPHIGVTLDRYVIMPNHVHLILVIHSDGQTEKGGRSAISNAVGYIKMNASKKIREVWGDRKVWQRGYYDHVIRNEEDYITIANYVEQNPLRWELDKLYREEIW